MSLLPEAHGWGCRSPSPPLLEVATVVGARRPLPRLLGAPALRHRARPCSLALLQNFLYKCIGTTLGAASSKEVVRKHLQELLETARHQEEAEREVVPSPEPLSPLRHSACACVRACACDCTSLERVRAQGAPSHPCPCPGVSAPVRRPGPRLLLRDLCRLSPG